ncbi:hypothetical protein FHT40_002226 [Mycolicibacterium sp. BK556]|uniref:DUF1254 domain-containing protein n=1 Tax=unclassified Mycolicibacterium TaxID=2636767 RepID=UPI001609B8D7|nr:MULTISPECIES: DUF1254 domain-containing protein [unclassified Mycolicibacterium]MBB3602593.1 hypothetical protein [Mycolicibacterium sp. BK556]MBB3632345.1 hypothetical protein [Mycolicibacterium sp. BK607]MBB3750366.1 hypothetical protein [Mycolicibacterium sp. BK634]
MTSGSDGSPAPSAGEPLTSEQVRAIAKEAYIYGFPMVDTYRIQYSYFVDTDNPEYKGAWNQVHSIARVYTPADTAIQTPNSDTPYSMVGADLRSEPLVLHVPPIETGRYYSLQFVDGYTHNFAYVGSRATGNGGGTYLLAGPGWDGATPEGIDDVIRSDTDFVLVVYRTQLFGPDDLDNVETIQAGYTAQPLSAFLDQPAPTPAPALDFPAALTPDEQKTSPEFFGLLTFLLGFAPTLPSEQDLRARIARLSDEPRDALAAGIADAWVEFGALKQKIDAGQVRAGELFGTKDDLAGNYLYRMAGAVLGIYGNSVQEAMYPVLATDAAGQPLTGAHDYTLTFPAGGLPPVNAFWSVTMYRLPESLLVDNPIDRYLINSPMLPNLLKDSDGGVTIYVQNSSPGADREANWLPAPGGPFVAALRLYWPKADALDGTWQPPKMLQA